MENILALLEFICAIWSLALLALATILIKQFSHRTDLVLKNIEDVVDPSRLTVHGRWEEASDGDGAVCSVCREDFCTITYEQERLHYCPNCGAKMDE